MAACSATPPSCRSITDPIGNSRALNNVRIRSAENFGVDKTGPEIDDLVPDEELVLMNGAVLTFEVDDPDLETGENSSGLDDGKPLGVLGSQQQLVPALFLQHPGLALPAGVVSDVEDGVVTIMTDGDDEIDKERRYVVVALVQDNAVPPNRSSTSFAYTRDSEGPAVSLSKSQSDIGNIGTQTVTVGVGGTITDKNVIKVADLSIRMIAADAGADACAWRPKISRRAGRVAWSATGGTSRTTRTRSSSTRRSRSGGRPAQVLDRRRIASGWPPRTSRSEPMAEATVTPETTNSAASAWAGLQLTAAEGSGSDVRVHERRLLLVQRHWWPRIRCELLEGASADERTTGSSWRM